MNESEPSPINFLNAAVNAVKTAKQIIEEDSKKVDGQGKRPTWMHGYAGIVGKVMLRFGLAQRSGGLPYDLSSSLQKLYEIKEEIDTYRAGNSLHAENPPQEFRDYLLEKLKLAVAFEEEK
jgi:hypothetical protein